MVRHYPFHKRGWLVLNNPDSSVVNWEVKYYKKSFVENDTITTLLERIVLAGKNYYYMPELYWNRELQDSNDRYYFTIKGTKTDNSTFNDGPHYLPDFPVGGFLVCHSSCNGKTFAYSLDAYQDAFSVNGTALLDHYKKPIANGLVETAQYEYMTASEFNYILGNNFWNQYYGLYTVDIEWLKNQGRVIVLQNDNPYLKLKDRDGLIILDPVVYGIKKSLGYWRNHNFSEDLGGGLNNFCNKNLFDKIDHFNTLVQFGNYYDHYLLSTPVPDLYCDQITSLIEFDHDLEIGDLFIECVETLSDPQDESDYLNMDQYVSFIAKCIKNQIENSFENFWNDPTIINDYSDFWPANVAKIQIKNVEDDSTIIELNYHERFNKAGQFIGTSYYTPKGLYELKLIGENGNIFTILVEMKNDVENGLKMSDFLDVVVYPNPISQSLYNINMSANENDVTFIYKMFDSNSNLRETESFVIGAQKNITRTYSPMVTEYPNGIMVHQFIFIDGSVKTVTGLKVSQ